MGAMDPWTLWWLSLFLYSKHFVFSVPFQCVIDLCTPCPQSPEAEVSGGGAVGGADPLADQLSPLPNTDISLDDLLDLNALDGMPEV